MLTGPRQFTALDGHSDRDLASLLAWSLRQSIRGAKLCALDFIRTPDIKQAGFDAATQWRRSPVRATRRARRAAPSNSSAGIFLQNVRPISATNDSEMAAPKQPFPPTPRPLLLSLPDSATISDSES